MMRHNVQYDGRPVAGIEITLLLIKTYTAHGRTDETIMNKLMPPKSEINVDAVADTMVLDFMRINLKYMCSWCL